MCFGLANQLNKDVREVMSWPVNLIREWYVFLKLTEGKPTED